MILALRGIIPPEKWISDPSKLYYYHNNYNFSSSKTIAMILAYNNMNIP